MDRDRLLRQRSAPLTPPPAASSSPAPAPAPSSSSPSPPPRRTQSFPPRPLPLRPSQTSSASQLSKCDGDAQQDLSFALDGRNGTGVPASAPLSPGVTPLSATPQQQQQKQAAQQQMLPVQGNSQQIQQQVQPCHSQQNHHQSASGGASGPPGQASGEGRRISCDDIQLVQNLIERCLQLYMNRAEVINTLLNQAKIEPGFTGLVWQKLEEQNPEFFKAYYVRLKLKRQIMVFNHLLEQHAQQTQKMHPAKATLASSQNGTHMLQVHHPPIGYPVPQQPSMAIPNHPHMVTMPVTSLSPPVLGGGPVPEAFGAVHTGPVSNGVGDINPEIPLLPTAASIPMNSDLSICPTTVLQGSPAFPFTAMGTPTDISGMGMDVSGNFPADTSFHSGENHAQNGMGALQMTTDGDTSGGKESFSLLGLGPLPRSFSLSDLTAELTNSSDILENYSGSPFLTPDADVFIHSPDDEKMGEQITDPASYDFKDEK